MKVTLALASLAALLAASEATAAGQSFKADPPIDPMRIIELVQKHKHIKFAGNQKLRIERSFVDVKDRAQAVRDVLRALGQPVVREPA